MARRKEPKDNPTLYVRERLDYSACVWEMSFLAGFFLINSQQTPWVVFYQEKILGSRWIIQGVDKVPVASG